MSVVDGQVVEERHLAPIGSTAGIPTGTLLYGIPAAPAKGPTPDAPVVAVNAISPWKSEILKICGGLIALEASLEAIDIFVTIPAWRHYVHPVVIACAAGRIAWLRWSTNSVIRTPVKA